MLRIFKVDGEWRAETHMNNFEDNPLILLFLQKFERDQRIPARAICLYPDGDRWCAVNGDFENQQVSSIGFGKSYEEAMWELEKAKQANAMFGIARGGNLHPGFNVLGARSGRLPG